MILSAFVGFCREKCKWMHETSMARLRPYALHVMGELLHLQLCWMVEQTR
jgi:hypothetical protein